jgi:hypothetical protein
MNQLIKGSKKIMACIEKDEIITSQNRKSPMLANEEIIQKRVNLEIRSQYIINQLISSNHDHPEEIQQAMNQETQKHDDFLHSVGATDTLMVMLATQMSAIHDLQQREYIFASQKNIASEKRQIHINAITKLSNIFIQQVALMQKLQGKGQQKVTVEHVHVHNGGQAIVGHVDSSIRRGGDGREKI